MAMFHVFMANISFIYIYMALPFFGIGMKTDLSSPVAIAKFSNLLAY